MNKPLLAIALLLLLLLTAGGQQTARARAVPWDCSDWQAFAHADRDISILESLAENRGKTLYCGIDQSDTFAKTETWEAGRNHNERDDTVYYGERGRFRGFIAAQEGWLTDGESGITGQSIAVIFEFPQEPPRRARRIKRFAVGTDPEQFPLNAETSCGQVLGLICTDYPTSQYPLYGNLNTAQQRARQDYGDESSGTDWEIHWRTRARRVRSQVSGQPQRIDRSGTGGGHFLTEGQWKSLAADAARRACRSRGAQYAGGSADFGEGHNENRGGNPLVPGVSNASPEFHGASLGWFYIYETNPLNTSTYRAKGRESRTWTATCEKKGPRRDR